MSIPPGTLHTASGLLRTEAQRVRGLLRHAREVGDGREARELEPHHLGLDTLADELEARACAQERPPRAPARRCDTCQWLRKDTGNLLPWSCEKQSMARLYSPLLGQHTARRAGPEAFPDASHCPNWLYRIPQATTDSPPPNPRKTR